MQKISRKNILGYLGLAWGISITIAFMFFYFETHFSIFSSIIVLGVFSICSIVSLLTFIPTIVLCLRYDPTITGTTKNKSKKKKRLHIFTLSITILAIIVSSFCLAIPTFQDLMGGEFEYNGGYEPNYYRRYDTAEFVDSKGIQHTVYLPVNLPTNNNKYNTNQQDLLNIKYLPNLRLITEFK